MIRHLIEPGTLRVLPSITSTIRFILAAMAGGVAWSHSFKHGQHIAFAGDDTPPLANLYVSMLQRLGIETDRFGSSTGTLSGLEMAG